MTPEILINIAVMLVAIVALVAIGLRIMNGEMEGESAEERYHERNTPKPPPEPEN